METPRRELISRLYHAALERPAAERSAFLSEACVKDDALRQEVESLLRYEPASKGFLEQPAAEIVAAIGPSVGTQMLNRQVGPYKIVASLGAGGMGEVYRARDTKLGRDVALKILPAHLSGDPERRARFSREARLLATLNHPHIGAIYGLEEGDLLTAIVLELVEGPTLAQRLERGPLPINAALAVAGQIAEALSAAHERGIIHRDLKPSNIVLQRESAIDASDLQVKVLDFGLAKPIAAESDVDVTERPDSFGSVPGGILGTPSYMSPEQARGLAVDQRSDVWAFGCVLFEMLTGRRAFQASSVADTLSAIMRDVPDWSRVPTETPHLIRWLLRKCLEKDPKRRLSDMRDVRLALEDVPVVDASVMMPAQSSPRSHSSQIRYWTFMVAAISTLAFAGIVTVAVRNWRERPSGNPAIQFTIVPPVDVTLTRPVQIAVSPDGQRIVYSATGRSGDSMLWLRPLRSLVSKVLPGTEGATHPFWSPDGQSIGFFSGAKLRTLRVEDGPVVIVCDAAAGRGGTWNAEGVIVFSAAADAPLQRVSAAGGVPVAVTRLDPPKANSHRMPMFLPDGKHFIFLSGGSGPQGDIKWHIKAGALDTTETETITDAELGSSPTFSAGHLLFALNRSLMSMPFDPATRRPAGASFPISDQPISSTGTASAAFSAAPSGVLAFVAVPPTDMRLTWINRGGKPVGTIGDPGAYAQLSLSPDERQIAVSLDTGVPRNQDVWIIDLSHQAPRRLTFSPGQDYAPIWSPDGSMVYFASTSTGVINMFRKPSDGNRSEEALLRSDRSQLASDVSRDEILAFTQVTAAGTDLWTLTLTGHGEPKAFLEGPSAKSSAVFSPDGRWLAYQSNESGRNEVYVRPFPRGEAQHLVSKGDGTRPRWAQNGREIFFLAGRTMMSVPIEVADKFAVGAVRPLFSNPAIALGSTFAVTRDSQQFLLLLEGGPVSNPVTVVSNWRSGVK